MFACSWNNPSTTSMLDDEKEQFRCCILNIRCTHEVCIQTYSWGASAPLLWTCMWKPYMYGSAWFYLNACWTDGSICMDKHWSKLAQAECWEKNVFWPHDLDLWPMTLIFKVNQDLIYVNPWLKFGDLRTIGSAVIPLKVLSVGALKEKIKNKK